ncbi:hypothetical protein Q31a_42060 [Aureliella helgolandensis]|uniref:Uncharacterized protein n=2 Tax=Aureliella helgolandensis TaxID=2527968 RepID=A0A518GBA2_9BACT|nr:hypothetical protein Q31a_42060 [Aureliella helgolandensis]
MLEPDDSNSHSFETELQTYLQLIAFIYDRLHSNYCPSEITKNLNEISLETEIPEAIEAIASVKGLRWEDVPDYLIDRSHPSLLFIGKEALRYYLPAFLSAIVRNAVHEMLFSQSMLQSDVQDSLFLTLFPSTTKTSCMVFWTGLTGEQFALYSHIFEMLDNVGFFDNPTKRKMRIVFGQA